MIDYIETVDALEALYGTPGEASIVKVARQMTPLYRQWIMASRFCVLSTTGAEGTDASPRGDEGTVVAELDPQTLALPDWRGNNRLDSLRNIVSDGRVSLMFMIAGSNNVVRVNGQAKLTDDAGLCAKFARGQLQPRTVIIVQIAEIYVQCARALLRSDLWRGKNTDVQLPTVGDLLREATDGELDGTDYDKAWPDRASKTMW